MARREGGRRRTSRHASLERSLVMRERPPWYDRLEARITITLVTIGILCVGASSYLVALAVSYYEQVGAQQDGVQVEALELAEPYYAELAAAQREAFVASTQLLPHELEGLDESAQQAFLDAWIAARANVVEVSIEGQARDALVVEGEQAQGALAGWRRVPIEAPLLDAEHEQMPAGIVRVTWAVDPAVTLRHQRLGELTRSLGTVEIADAGGRERVAERDEVRDAVITALSIASSLVLFVAILAGILIARRTTRKVSDLSEVMRRVASGDLSQRAPRLGGDELGVLASAFNTMLDELEETRQRIAYLQRVGAWQEMARRIAHEIKNPLTPIQLAVQQLREKDPGQDERFSRLLRDSVEIVEDEVEALRRMVTSFSQFAKVPEVELEPVELGRVLVDFERAYAHLEAELELRSSLEGEQAALWIQGDRQLLKQVLVNLAENAALSAKEAGVEAPKILVSVGLLEREPRVRVSVEDNGPGVAPERRELVFEPYETTRAHGTGLGLAIVKKIMLDHGGEIRVDTSEELGGARFELRLRAAAAPAGGSDAHERRDAH